jgi:hypothetical protein
MSALNDIIDRAARIMTLQERLAPGSACPAALLNLANLVREYFAAEEALEGGGHTQSTDDWKKARDRAWSARWALRKAVE